MTEMKEAAPSVYIEQREREGKKKRIKSSRLGIQWRAKCWPTEAYGSFGPVSHFKFRPDCEESLSLCQKRHLSLAEAIPLDGRWHSSCKGHWLGLRSYREAATYTRRPRKKKMYIFFSRKSERPITTVFIFFLLFFSMELRTRLSRWPINSEIEPPTD